MEKMSKKDGQKESRYPYPHWLELFRGWAKHVLQDTAMKLSEDRTRDQDSEELENT